MKEKSSITLNSFKYALGRSVPVLIGFFPVGVAYGILMENIGYSFIWSALTSIFVYAGSLQMLMVSFFAENIPIISVIVTSLLLNSRHLFYGLSFIEKIRSYGAWRFFMVFTLTDESYSLLCSYKDRDDVDEKKVHIFSAGLIYLYWICFSALGGLVGHFISFDTTGIDFALTALFIVILSDGLRSAKSKIPAVIAAVSCVLCIIIFGADNFLLPSLLISVAALTVLRRYIEKASDTAPDPQDTKKEPTGGLEK